MGILSIQSSVAYGYVGNAAATAALQRLGHEVWPVNTVEYSNHPGHGNWKGRMAEADEITAIVDGLADLDVWRQCPAVLSGYMGSTANGRAALAAVAAVKKANSEALYCCDPVMGDGAEGVYVDEDLIGFFKTEAGPRSDILVPNIFEAEILAGQPLDSADAALAAADFLRDQGPDLVVITSLPAEKKETAMMATLAVSSLGAWRVSTPRVETEAKGAGDLFSALFLGNYLGSRNPADALAATVSAVFAVLDATEQAGRRELALIEAQDALARPSRMFETERVR